VITFSTELIPATVNDYREKIVSSLEHFKGQSAVFTTNPGILQQLWPFIEETGVPHDQIALACFDHPYPGLPEDVVVVKAVQPLEQIARRSVRILLDKLRGVHRLEQQRIEATIEVIGIDQLAGCDLAAAGQALRS
jgi:DNA-binding LacI/PurR family transcriptional regulator